MSPAHDSLLYARVETVLAGEITNGDLKVGDQLPTEDSLIVRFGVSRITVRRAIPCEPRPCRDSPRQGHIRRREEIHALGRKPTARVLGREIVAANTTVATQLALTRGEHVVRIRRVRLADRI